jgi:hypothetical protein
MAGGSSAVRNVSKRAATVRLIAILSMLGVLTLRTPAAMAQETTLDFVVERNETEIGSHRIHLARQGGRLVVDTDVAIRVTVAFITVYRFTHHAREVWEGDRLVTLDAETDDDGTPHRLTVRGDGEGLRVIHNGTEAQAPGGLIPTSLWNPAIVRQVVLLGTLRGDAMPTQVTPMGSSAIAVPGGEVAADGFLVDASPDYKRWVWYDGSGRLVAVRLVGRDGSAVRYRLR